VKPRLPFRLEQSACVPGSPDAVSLGSLAPFPVSNPDDSLPGHLFLKHGMAEEASARALCKVA